MKKISIKKMVNDITRDWAHEFEPDEDWDGENPDEEYILHGVYRDEPTYEDKKTALWNNKMYEKIRNSTTFKDLYSNMMKLRGNPYNDLQHETLMFFSDVFEDFSDSDLENQYYDLFELLEKKGIIAEDSDQLSDDDKLKTVKFLLKNQDAIFKK